LGGASRFGGGSSRGSLGDVDGIRTDGLVVARISGEGRHGGHGGSYASARLVFPVLPHGNGTALVHSLAGDVEVTQRGGGCRKAEAGGRRKGSFSVSQIEPATAKKVWRDGGAICTRPLSDENLDGLRLMVMFSLEALAFTEAACEECFQRMFQVSTLTNHLP